MIRIPFAAWTAVFSERSDGDLRVTSRSAAEPLATVQNRVLEALAVPAIAVARQVHGTVVVAVDRTPCGYNVGVGEGDGVATARVGIGAAVHVADCLPIALGGNGGVAMLHGGWRGLAAGIIPEGVRALRSLGVTGEFEAAIGPGAGGCCYETGDEVREHFAGAAASHGRLLDLKAVAAKQLLEAGAITVRDVGLCTICAPGGRFFSHRRDGATTGRQGGFAWLR
jgi:YfiH family protein